MAAVAAAVAAACSYLGASLDGKAAAALPYVIAGIGVIAAWVIVWMPIEELLFDWRLAAYVVAVFGPLVAGPPGVHPAAHARSLRRAFTWPRGSQRHGATAIEAIDE